jgi:hypothetical protein
MLNITPPMWFKNVQWQNTIKNFANGARNNAIVHTCLISFIMYIDVCMLSVTMMLVYENKVHSFTITYPCDGGMLFWSSYK